MTNVEQALQEAARRIRGAHVLAAFCGAGISVDSGLPTFRGDGGIWGKWDPSLLELEQFWLQPERSWAVIKELFSAVRGVAGRAEMAANAAHRILAKWERAGRLKLVITQNIDGLHQAAGSQRVVELHGHMRTLGCRKCGRTLPWTPEQMVPAVPRCPCGGVLKPDFVFFGEALPAEALAEAEKAARTTDCLLVIGTSGVVYPAATIPQMAKRAGATLIEINPGTPVFAEIPGDVFLPLGATEALGELDRRLSTG